MNKEETELTKEESLQLQLAIEQDLRQLKDDAYFRQQLLASLERIAVNIEAIANAKK